MEGRRTVAEQGPAQQALDLAASLLERLRDPAIDELEVREGDVRVKVTRARDGAPLSAGPAVEAEVRTEPAPAPKAAPAKQNAKEIAAPLTGIFYRSPSPQAPAFVQPGSVVAVGDVVGLIEAMKLFNEVRSPVGGRIHRIVAENGKLVRAHQALYELE